MNVLSCPNPTPSLNSGEQSFDARPETADEETIDGVFMNNVLPVFIADPARVDIAMVLVTGRKTVDPGAVAIFAKNRDEVF
jgi:hypothetical protein